METLEQLEKLAVVLGTIQGNIEGLERYLQIADPTATETIKRAEIELNCLRNLMKAIESE
ncbi:hypothetical protein D8Z79_025890 (plasmid) [Escherichia fergusonii]|uniref:Uncharacterized protein n=1 Tax=Lysinibacillus pakistanensis TaxID=759811 RepID=A0ABX6DH46_9BACI|nr:hypothetical protein [Escherichia fergusonii]QCZ35032.1 hypothetical protein D8Z79_025665 [Escherichia fergusonii]QCZ35076.1 hypothetical protein D8Z79_025890 [Escherichia fergusonii]QGG54085.1 hypothetical protein GDS87_24505 [Lysinibacillus pakistanensis]QGG54140.1 hypothetical protein GDS87_24785 [Lysinibacillus pakistanensis]